MGMTAPAACLLLSQFPSAIAQLYAEVQRLWRSFPQAEAQKCLKFEEAIRDVRPAVMMTAVRSLCVAHKESVQKLQSCGAEACSAMHFTSWRESMHCGLAVLNSTVQLVHCKLQSEALANLFCLWPLMWVLAQTLDTLWYIGWTCVSKRIKGNMLSAQVEGLMCPALVELVCEALGSSGRVPGRLKFSV